MSHCAALASALLLWVPAVAHAAGTDVRHFEPASVATAFEHGDALLEVPEFRVVASVRTSGGEAEVHRRETDIFYVVSGEAEFVTGGRLVDQHDTAPDEVRGNAIEGGTVHRLEPGSVIVVPAGTPHWFRRVSAPVRYFTVKPIRGDAS